MGDMAHNADRALAKPPGIVGPSTHPGASALPHSRATLTSRRDHGDPKARKHAESRDVASARKVLGSRPTRSGRATAARSACSGLGWPVMPGGTWTGGESRPNATTRHPAPRWNAQTFGRCARCSTRSPQRDDPGREAPLGLWTPPASRSARPRPRQPGPLPPHSRQGRAGGRRGA